MIGLTTEIDDIQAVRSTTSSNV